MFFSRPKSPQFVVPPQVITASLQCLKLIVNISTKLDFKNEDSITVLKDTTKQLESYNFEKQKLILENNLLLLEFAKMDKVMVSEMKLQDKLSAKKNVYENQLNKLNNQTKEFAQFEILIEKTLSVFFQCMQKLKSDESPVSYLNANPQLGHLPRMIGLFLLSLGDNYPRLTNHCLIIKELDKLEVPDILQYSLFNSAVKMLISMPTEMEENRRLSKDMEIHLGAVKLPSLF